MPFPFSYQRKIEWVRGGSRNVDAIRSALAVELEAAGLKDVEDSEGVLKFRASVLEQKIFAYGSVFADVKSGKIQVLQRDGQITILYRLKLFTKQILGSLAFVALLGVSTATGSIAALVASIVLTAALCLLVFGLNYLQTARDFNHMIRRALRDLRPEDSPDGFRDSSNSQLVLH